MKMVNGIVNFVFLVVVVLVCIQLLFFGIEVVLELLSRL